MNKEALTAKLDALNKEMETSGMGLAAAIDGDVKFTYYYGMQNKEKNIPVSDKTIFRAASVTQHMSAMVSVQTPLLSRISHYPPSSYDTHLHLYRGGRV